MTTPDTATTPGDAVRVATAGSALVRAARKQPVPHTPVWFMRQAGRSLPEYREVRRASAMLDVVPPPRPGQPRSRCSRCAATASTPRSSSPTSSCRCAAIGVDLDIVARRRPRGGRADPHARPTSTQLRAARPDDVADITEAVRLLVGRARATPLIGFAGAPFTLASYLVEGGPSKNHEHTKALMLRRPRGCGTTCAPGWPRSRARSCACRSRPAPRPCSCSTRGRVRCPRRLPALRAAALGRGARSRRRPRRAAHPLRCRHRRAARARWARPEPTSSVSTAASRSTTRRRRLGRRYAVQGNLDPALLFAPWTSLERTGTRGRRARAGPRPATCSTSATGCCPTPTPTCSPESSSWCTRSPRGDDAVAR